MDEPVLQRSGEGELALTPRNKQEKWCFREDRSAEVLGKAWQGGVEALEAGKCSGNGAVGWAGTQIQQRGAGSSP